MESKNITLGEDGAYHWTYEMSLYRHPWIFFLVWKVFMMTVAIVSVILFLIMVFERDFWWKGFFGLVKGIGWGILGASVLAAVGYLVYALLMGGVYCVAFTMDGKGVNHAQVARQAKRVRVVSILAAILAIFSKRPTIAGTALLSSRTSMYSDFSKVRAIIPQPKRDTIKLNAPFNHNQVYAKPEDFEWVLAYIRERCGKAKAE